MAEHTFLECPCCGCEGAESDDEGMFFDGQLLICGCPGHVYIDEGTPCGIELGEGAETEELGTAYISNGDEPCGVNHG